MKTITSLLATLSLLAILRCPGQAQNAPDEVERVLVSLQFKAADKEALLKGDILSSDPKESTDKELAITIAALMPGDPAKIIDLIRQQRLFEVNTDILKHGTLSDPPEAMDFQAVAFDESEKNEVADLFKVERGSDFNLSTEELAQFETLRQKFRGKNPKSDPAVAEAVVQTYRSILLARSQAYAKEGLKAIAHYQRGKEKFASPHDELSQALLSDFTGHPRAMAFLTGLRDFPKNLPDDADSQLIWIKQRVQDRPCFILLHTLIDEAPDYALVAQRQFYVGHTFNSLQILVGCLPAPKGTVVFYRNRTSTDQVAGVGSGLRHKIGRDMMRKEVLERFQRVRALLEKSP